MQLNGGTLRDHIGQNSTLTFVPPNTTAVIVNAKRTLYR
jgi:hypothetical protein